MKFKSVLSVIFILPTIAQGSLVMVGNPAQFTSAVTNLAFTALETYRKHSNLKRLQDHLIVTGENARNMSQKDQELRGTRIFKTFLQYVKDSAPSVETGQEQYSLKDCFTAVSNSPGSLKSSFNNLDDLYEYKKLELLAKLLAAGPVVTLGHYAVQNIIGTTVPGILSDLGYESYLKKEVPGVTKALKALVAYLGVVIFTPYVVNPFVGLAKFFALRTTNVLGIKIDPTHPHYKYLKRYMQGGLTKIVVDRNRAAY